VAHCDEGVEVGSVDRNKQLTLSRTGKAARINRGFVGVTAVVPYDQFGEAQHPIRESLAS